MRRFRVVGKRVACVALVGALCVCGVPAAALCVDAAAPPCAAAADAATCAVNFHYCTKDAAADELVWQSTTKVVNAGGVPSWSSTYLNTFVCNGASYTFLGWTASESVAVAAAGGQTASADDYTAKGKNLPAVQDEESLDYWAVYRKTVLRYEVSFIVGDTTYTAKDVAYGAMLADVWAGSEAAFVDGKPSWRNTPPSGDPVYTGDEEDMEFAGWALKEDATTPENPSLTKSGQKFHPVFSKIPSCTITFMVNGSEDGTANALAGTELADVHAQTPVAYGKRFAGWGNEDGVRVTTVPRGDTCTLYAQWEDIKAYGDDASGSTLDVSKAYVGVAGVADANDVYATIDYVSGSSAFGKLAEADGYEYQAAFSLQLKVEHAGKLEKIETGFGQITARLCWGGIHEGDKVKVYWTRADGTQGSVTKTAGANEVACSFTTLDMSAETNVAIARVPEYLNKDTTESDAQKAAVDRSAHVAPIVTKKAKSKKDSSKKSSKKSSSSSNKKSSSSNSAPSSYSGSSRADGTPASSLTNSGTLGSSLSNRNSTGASLTNSATSGSSLGNNTTLANAAERSAGSTSAQLNQEQGELQQLANGPENAEAQTLSDASTPQVEEESQATPSLWPFAVAAVAIAALGAWFVMFAGKRRKQAEAVADQPLTDADNDDIASANF